MESKKAKDFIFEHKHCAGTYAEEEMCVLDLDVEAILEIAEKEMKEKAIEAHRLLCHWLSCDNPKCWADKSNIHKCDSNCPYMKNFISQLNK